MLCPLIADGWSLTVRPATPNSTGNESRRQVNYVFTRSGDTPMVFITTRFEKVGKPAIEMLNEIKTADRNFLYEQAWPFRNEVFAQDFAECECCEALGLLTPAVPDNFSQLRRIAFWHRPSSGFRFTWRFELTWDVHRHPPTKAGELATAFTTHYSVAVRLWIFIAVGRTAI